MIFYGCPPDLSRVTGKLSIESCGKQKGFEGHAYLSQERGKVPSESSY